MHDVLTAPAPKRVGAALIDAAVIAAVYVPLTLLVTKLTATDAKKALVAYLALALITAVLALAYYSLKGTARGTLGMRLMGTRAVDANTLAPLGVWRAVARQLVLGVSGVTVIGTFSPLLDNTGQLRGWHDKAMGSRVVTAASADAAIAARNAPPPPVPKSPTIAVRLPGSPAAATTAIVTPAGPDAPASSLPTSVLPAFDDSAPAPAAAATRPAEGASGIISAVPGFSARGGETAAAPVTGPIPTAPIATVDAPAAASAFDVDGETRMAAPAIPLEALAPGVHLAWDDGTRHHITEDTLIGRDPSDDGRGPTRLIAVPDDTLSLSKTHAEIGFGGGRAWIIDRASTNGTTVIAERGEPERVPTDVRRGLSNGQTVVIGTRRCRVTVVQP